MSTNLGEIAVTAIFLALLALKLDPFRLLMPNDLQMGVLALVVAVFGLYAGLIFRQRARDERESLHIHRASRGGYLAGVGLLVVAIVAQSFMGRVDRWLFYILAGMVIVRLAIMVWARIRN